MGLKHNDSETENGAEIRRMANAFIQRHERRRRVVSKAGWNPFAHKLCIEDSITKAMESKDNGQTICAKLFYDTHGRFMIEFDGEYGYTSTDQQPSFQNVGRTWAFTCTRCITK